MNNTTLILSLFVIIFFFMYFLPLIWAKGMRGRQSPDLSNFLTNEQKSYNKLLVYFWSPSCGMCRGMTTVIDGLMQNREDVLKVNAAENPELARQFKIMGTPTLVLVERGNIAEMVVGAKSEKTILALLD